MRIDEESGRYVVEAKDLSDRDVIEWLRGVEADNEGARMVVENWGEGPKDGSLLDAFRLHLATLANYLDLGTLMVSGEPAAALRKQ